MAGISMTDCLEHDILIRCALRFDGYKFRDMNTRPGLDVYLEAPWTSFELHSCDLFNLARFFFLQRYLYKWGGDRIPPDAREHQLFRFLFLHVYRLEIPPEYRMENHDWYQTWEKHYKPRQEYYAAIIRNTFMSRPLEEIYNTREDTK